MRLTVMAFVAAGMVAGAMPVRAADLDLVSIGPAMTQAASPGPIAKAVEAWARRWAEGSHGEASSAGQAEQAGERGWIGRHPVLFGALVGAGAGAVIGYSLGRDCSGRGTGSCSSREGAALVGGAIFAGAGAVVGLIVEKARD